MRRAVYALIPLVVGLAMGLWGIVDFAAARATQSWPKAKGVITSSQILQLISDDSNPPRRVNYGVLAYAYTIGEEEFVSTAVSSKASEQRLDDDATGAFLARYPQGLEVDVYYNPAIPSQAVLERAGYVLPISYMAAGAFIVLASMASMFFGIRSRWVNGQRGLYEEGPHPRL